jgi:hypothetical protein
VIQSRFHIKNPRILGVTVDNFSFIGHLALDLYTPVLLNSTSLTESCENCRNPVYFSFDEPLSARTTGQGV